MSKVKRFVTDYLFSTPTFLTGAGSVMNLSGIYYKYNISESETEADCKAIRNDFDMVGQDLNDAIEALDKDIKAKK